MKSISTRFRTLILCTLLWPAFSQAQVKYEREFGIKPQDAPAAARAFIEDCFGDKKVKWYMETSQEGSSFEAKARFNGKKYSVEFDTLGRLEDVEVLIGTGSVPNPTRATMDKVLLDTFAKYRIRKVQLQWIGPVEAMRSLVSEENTHIPHETRYELVVKGKRQQHWKLYEVLFDAEGNMLRLLEIAVQETDNLIY